MFQNHAQFATSVACHHLHGTGHRARDSYASQFFIFKVRMCAGAFDQGRSEPAELRVLLGTKDPYQSGTAQRYHDLLHPTDRYPSRPYHFNDQLPASARAWPSLPDRRMHGGKRGLVAPQNTFLENIVRRSSGKMISSDCGILHSKGIKCVSNELTFVWYCFKSSLEMFNFSLDFCALWSG